jgi:hypothetical protein
LGLEVGTLQELIKIWFLPVFFSHMDRLI